MLNLTGTNLSAIYSLRLSQQYTVALIWILFCFVFLLSLWQLFTNFTYLEYPAELKCVSVVHLNLVLTETVIETAHINKSVLCASFPFPSGVCEQRGCVYIRWCKQHPKRSTVHTVGFIHSQVTTRTVFFLNLQYKVNMRSLKLLEFCLWDLASFFFSFVGSVLLLIQLGYL